MTYTQAAQAALDALKAFNDMDRAWIASAKANGYASFFKERPRISDELHLELLREVAFFDGDAQESLDNLTAVMCDYTDDAVDFHLGEAA